MIYDFPATAYMESGLERPRATLDDLGAAMLAGLASGELPEVDLPLEHFHPAGLYARKIFMPADTAVMSRVHAKQHLTVALTGKCRVVDQDGNEQIITAPAIWITEPGTQRALHVMEDSIWLTVHASELQSVPELEEALTCKTMVDYKTKYLTGGDK